MVSLKALIVGVAGALLAGCTSYDFQISRPTELAQVITDASQRLQTPNMTYYMQAKEKRLVVRIFNESDEAVQLLGDRSFVVDPLGASHPLRNQAIAPKSYAKIILPPLRPRFEQRNPGYHFGVGVGTTILRQHRPAPVRVQYLDIYEDADSLYWDWNSEGPVRLSITYQFADGRAATDEFTIQKIERD